MSDGNAAGSPMNEPRESMEFDVVIVGAGPAGLAAAIRLKQANADLSVVVLEKGAEVGAHILCPAQWSIQSVSTKLNPRLARRPGSPPLQDGSEGRPSSCSLDPLAPSACRTS